MRIQSNNIFYEPQITVGIPSEKSYRFQISVRLRKFPVCEIKDNKETIAREVGDIVPLKINVCKLIFALDQSQLRMDLSNTDLHWKSTYNIVFFKNIYKQDIEHLSRWANNRTLSIGLEITGVAIVEESLLEFQLEQSRAKLLGSSPKKELSDL
jgi:hypothetical protein